VQVCGVMNILQGLRAVSLASGFKRGEFIGDTNLSPISSTAIHHHLCQGSATEAKASLWAASGVQVTRVNSANVLDEGLRIKGRLHWMNSKVKIRQTRRGLTCIKNKRSTQLAQSQSVRGRPLLAPLYRWSGLEEPVRFNTNYNVCIRCHLVFQLHLNLGLF
jgi:hypothetical protein